MRVFAYCCASFAESARKAAGVEPLLSPPTSADTFTPTWLEGYDLLYFDLHGNPYQRFWQGDGGIVALTADQVRQADLHGVVVFAVNCYLADTGAPMMDALLDAGVSYVIGGEGQNWAAATRVTGAAELGWRFRQVLERGFDPLRALALAKRWLELGMVARQMIGQSRKLTGESGEVFASKDTLEFRAYYREVA